MEQQVKMPTIQELNASPEEAYKNDQLKYILNVPPPEAWLKKHPMAPAMYLPIDKIEFLLDRIFQSWRIEVLREGTMFNSVYVTVRVHYKNPITGEWSYHDGVGAADVQTSKGSSPAALENIIYAAIQKGLPAAKSFAIKDACDHLGDIFGRNVNRKDSVSFQGAYAPVPFVEDKSEERLILLIQNAKSKFGLTKLEEKIKTDKAREEYNKKYSELVVK